MTKITYSQAINKALIEEMNRNKKLVCFGLGVNDSLNFFGTTKGLEKNLDLKEYLKHQLQKTR